jgi:hypothetical protein
MHSRDFLALVALRGFAGSMIPGDIPPGSLDFAVKKRDF